MGNQITQEDFNLLWDFFSKDQTADRKEYTAEEQKDLFEKFTKEREA